MLSIMQVSTQPYQCMITIQSPTINHLPGFLPCRLDGNCSIHLNPMRVTSMNILHVQWQLTTNPTTAFLIPSDSRVRSSRSSSAPITRLGQDRDDWHSNSDASTISSLDLCVTSIGETCRKRAYPANDSMAAAYPCQHYTRVSTQLCKMALECLQLFTVLSTCLQ